MIPELFLVCACWGAFCSLIANVRAKRPVTLGLVFVIIGFATAELARFFMAFQLLATAVWVAFGALEEPEGWWGLGLTALSVAGLELAYRRGRADAKVVAEAFAGADTRLEPVELPRERVLRPFSHHRPGISVERDLSYGDHPRHSFDLFLPADASDAPIMVQIHGGGWVYGSKEQQGQALMAHAAEQGWIGVAVNYRLGPKARFPDILVDIKRAIAYTKDRAGEWGGNPDQLAVTGGSAGGHLTAMAALTGDDLRWQPGFETADCSVAAAIPFYGVYDFTDRGGQRGRAAMKPFLERMVMSTKLAEDPAGWDELSPVALVRPDAPPMMIIGCGYDLLVPIEETRDFVEAMRNTSDIAPLYVELPHAQHGFDVIASPRTLHVVHAVTDWASRAVRGVGATDS